METGPAVDPSSTRRFFEEKALRRSRRLDERFDAASEDARKIVSMLERDYSPHRIYQWGSLLDRARFSEISDIDIAVEEIAGTQAYFELYGKALAMTSFPLDLVELERIEPVHADSIRRSGKLLYERP